jgi:hypothetical protein
VLACVEEGLRHGGLGAIVGEVARLDMTASRRLQLCAEETGTIGIALRRWRQQTEPVTENPSALSLSGGVAGSPRRRGCAGDLGAGQGEGFPHKSSFHIGVLPIVSYSHGTRLQIGAQNDRL